MTVKGALKAKQRNRSAAAQFRQKLIDAGEIRADGFTDHLDAPHGDILCGILCAAQDAVYGHGLQELEDSDFGTGKPANTHSEWLTILSEEIGEVSRAIIERQGDDAVESELLDAAGTILCWIDSIRRKRAGGSPVRVEAAG